VPASFNFPHTGKLLSLSFVLFAGWFADVPVSPSSYPELALTGLVTFFGSLTAAVPFLLDEFRIPADTFQLFLATGVINSRVGSLVAAVHTLTVALCRLRGTGHLRWRRGRSVSRPYRGAVRGLGGTRVLCHGPVTGVFERPVLASYCSEPVEATVAHTAPVSARTCRRSRPLMRAGIARRTCRRCRSPSSIGRRPGGLRHELAHGLAREMGVSLAFVPVDRDRLAEQLAEGYCDLVMSGVVVTTDRARDMLFSDSYMDETLALVVPDHQRGQYETWDAIRDRGALTIAVPDVPYYVSKLRAMLPRATIQVHASTEVLFDRTAAPADALALPAERGSAWTLRYPAYSVVVPGPDPIRVPLAYPIGKRDGAVGQLREHLDCPEAQGRHARRCANTGFSEGAAPRSPAGRSAATSMHWVE
jgi:ABC-type amino acid transport substrate-binding protein